MKKYFCLVFILFFTSLLFARSPIKEGSSFMIMGELDLRTECGFAETVLYRTINHEGGMKVIALEVGKTGTYNDEKGVWLHILTTAPMWVDTGEWIEKYSKYWIFLPDSIQIFDYEEN